MSRPFLLRPLVVSLPPFRKAFAAVYDLVEINREPNDESPLEGFLLERTKDLILLNLVNPDVVCLNGY